MKNGPLGNRSVASGRFWVRCCVSLITRTTFLTRSRPILGQHPVTWAQMSSFLQPAPLGVNFGGATDLSPRSREFANRGEPFCFHRQMYNSRKQWASVCRSGRTIECPFLTAAGFGFACPFICNVTAFRAPFFESNNYSTAGRQAVRHGPRFGCTHGWTSVVRLT